MKNDLLENLKNIKKKELLSIHKIKEAFPNSWESSSFVGNDSAILDSNPDKGGLLISKDMAVQGVHFFENTPLYPVIYKSLLASASDILADGGIPESFIVGIGLDPKNQNQNRIDILTRSLIKVAQTLETKIIGGDTVFSPHFFISVTCIGRSYPNIWLKKNAQVNDYIYVAGFLGQSSYGLELIQKTGKINLSQFYIYKHLYPTYYKKLVSYLQENFKDEIHSATDISDAFITDLHEILIESNKGAVLFQENLPLDSFLKHSKKPDYALFSQEDYTLLFTSATKISEKDVLKATGFFISCIGYICKEKICVIKTNENQKKVDLSKMKSELYKHF